MKSNLFAATLTLAVSSLAAMGCSSSKTDSTPVGTLTVGTYTIDIAQEGAAVAPGATSRFVLKSTAGGKPTSITGWIGIASGEGSVKKEASYDANDGDFDDDVVAPKPLPTGAQFWIEVDTNGHKDVASIAWKK